MFFKILIATQRQRTMLKLKDLNLLAISTSFFFREGAHIIYFGGVLIFAVFVDTLTFKEKLQTMN